MSTREMKIPMCALLDRRMRERVADIIQKLGLTTVVETGIDKGGSTLLFSQMVGQVIGIDNDPAKINIVAGALQEYEITNVMLVQSNSPTALRQLAADDLDASKTLFLLDAHWQDYWPLKDEIRSIPRGQGVLVMHDAVVPNCPNLGFDEYKGQALSYEYLMDVLTEWSSDHVVEYNDDTAESPRRGVMIVYPNAQMRDDAR